MSRCKFIKNKKQCKAYSLKGSEFCWYHSPKNRIEVREAGKRGGEVSYDKGLIRADPIDLLKGNTPVVYLLVDTINRARKVRADGSMDLRTANCLGFLASKLIEAQRELITRDKLENLIDALKERGVI